MLFMFILSWVAYVIQVLFLIIGVSAGLYYLAELVEEYTVISKKVITWLSVGVIFVYVGLILFEEISTSLIINGILSQLSYLVILKDFPFFSLTSIQFVLGIILFLANHYFALQFFSSSEYPFSEVIAFFTICVWIVPFSLFISLSANENILPVLSENHSLHVSDHDNDVLGSYLSKKKKGYGLLTFLSNVQEKMLPRYKKIF